MLVVEDDGHTNFLCNGWIAIGIFLYHLFGKYSILFWSKEYDYIFVRNAYVMAMPYYLIGIVLGRSNTVFNKKKETINVFLALLFCIAEYYILSRTGVNTISNNYIGNGMLSLALVRRALADTNNKIDGLAYLGRYHSLNLYLFHPMVNDLLRSFFQLQNIKCQAPIVVVITTVLSVGVFYIRTRFFVECKGNQE